MSSKNVFITGSKHTGKTTAVRRFLEETCIDYKGFVTQRAIMEGNEEYSLHLLKSYDDVPTKDNFLFMCGKSVRDYDDICSRFDHMVPPLLKDPSDAGIIIMDELGPNEEGALLFHEAVTECLDSDVPVLGVLQDAESPFLSMIKERNDTAVITLTEENRDGVPGMIKELLTFL